VEAMLHALHEANPNKVSAGTSGTGGNFGLGGIHPETGENYIYGEPCGGGYGAGLNQDGENGFQPPISNVSDTPVETIESSFPLFVEYYGFIPDSGGVGRFRGGLGLRRDIRVLDHEAMLSLQGARTLVPPYGLEGGMPGRIAQFLLNPGTPEETVLKPLGTTSLKRGTVLSFQTPGGGGYGNPLERDPEKVRDDVLNGYVTQKEAERKYGVVIGSDTFHVNLEATAKLRFHLKELKGK
jgi:N-methylhydantoinase B